MSVCTAVYFSYRSFSCFCEPVPWDCHVLQRVTERVTELKKIIRNIHAAVCVFFFFFSPLIFLSSLVKLSMNKDGMNKDGMNKDAMNKDSMNKDSMNKDGINKDGIS